MELQCVGWSNDATVLDMARVQGDVCNRLGDCITEDVQDLQTRLDQLVTLMLQCMKAAGGSGAWHAGQTQVTDHVPSESMANIATLQQGGTRQPETMEEYENLCARRLLELTGQGDEDREAGDALCVSTLRPQTVWPDAV